MQEDVDFLVDLEADFVQFMLLTPMPVTGLYQDLKRRDLLRMDLSYQEWHGQKRLAYRHPSFAEGAPEAWLEQSFRQDYEHNGSSMLRMVETLLRGYQRLAEMPVRDTCLEVRMTQIREMARHYSLILGAVARNAVNEGERRRAVELDRLARQLLGRRSWEHLAAMASVWLAELWKVRLKLRGDCIQPKMIRTRYPAGRLIARRGAGKVEQLARRAGTTTEIPSAAAARTMVSLS
jgi:hypothetical protein